MYVFPCHIRFFDSDNSLIAHVVNPSYLDAGRTEKKNRTMCFIVPSIREIIEKIDIAKLFELAVNGKPDKQTDI